MKTEKIEGTAQAWENDLLGASEHAKKSKLSDKVVDESMDLQMISIRLQKSLLADLKNIALVYGIGYQPLMKQVLTRFVDSEMRMMANECLAKRIKEERGDSEAELRKQA